MEKIIATVYLTIIFILAIIYLGYHIGMAIEKRKYLKTKTPEPEKPFDPAADIMGKSYTVFLTPEDFPVKPEPIPIPAQSEDLEREPAAETEPDVSPGEVEAKLDRVYIPDESELDMPEDEDEAGTEGDLSQGLTFEQISHAVEVIEGKHTGEQDRIRAGETLAIMPADMLEFVTMQETGLFMVNKLIAGYLDHAHIKKPKPVMGFNMSKYVP